MFSTSGDIQYIGGYSVHRGLFSTSGGYHEYIGGISWVHRGRFSTLGDTLSTWEGYHEYIGGISWYLWGSKLLKTFQLLLKTPMYWTSPDVLMISPDVLNSIPPHASREPPHMHLESPPQCNEHPPMYSWYPSMYWTPPDAFMISPECTHGIPPMYWTSPDVLNTHYTGCNRGCNSHYQSIMWVWSDFQAHFNAHFQQLWSSLWSNTRLTILAIYGLYYCKKRYLNSLQVYSPAFTETQVWFFQNICSVIRNSTDSILCLSFLGDDKVENNCTFWGFVKKNLTSCTIIT